MDEDERLLIPALAAQGVEAEPVVWDSADARWDAFSLVVVRSTWDYSDQRDAFLAWASRLPRVSNAYGVLRWNTDKVYLQALESRGIPIVPTTWIRPGDDAATVAMPAGDVVVKPAISAGSRNTDRYSPAEHGEARAHIRRLLEAQRTVMLQPYVGAVDSEGETALIYFDGEFSHAARKAAILVQRNAAGDQLFAQERIAPHLARDAERALGERVLDSLPWPRHHLAYARVDVVGQRDGAPRVLEVELTEPSLFLGHHPEAPARLAAAISRRLAARAV